MSEKNLTIRRGVGQSGKKICWSVKGFLTAFTITELMVTVAVASIAVFGTGIILVDSQNGWNRMYNHVYSDVVIDAYVARRAFDSVVRRSSTRKVDIGDNGESARVYYYRSTASLKPDRYACFHTVGDKLLVEYGPKTISGTPKPGMTSTITLARNVQSVKFSVVGTSLHMILKLDDGRQALTVTTSAHIHNS